MSLELTDKGEKSLERLELHFRSQPGADEFTPRSITWVVLSNTSTGVDVREVVGFPEEIMLKLRTSVIALKRDGFLIDTEEDI